MVLKQFEPRSGLASFVRAFEIVETQESITRMLLPDTGILIGFRYSGYATMLDGTPAGPLPTATVTGLRASARAMHTSANGGIVIAKFRAAAAASFFSTPLHHLFGLTRALSQVVDADEVALTADRVARATSDDARVAIVGQFLKRRYRPVPPDPVVSGALRAIDEACGAIRVGSIARDLHISQDTLEKRFRRVVGASPKQFTSIVRLRRAVELSRKSTSLTSVALDAGYYDQSHFIRDFRAVTGAAPGPFLGADEYC